MEVCEPPLSFLLTSVFTAYGRGYGHSPNFAYRAALGIIAPETDILLVD